MALRIREIYDGMRTERTLRTARSTGNISLNGSPNLGPTGSVGSSLSLFRLFCRLYYNYPISTVIYSRASLGSPSHSIVGRAKSHVVLPQQLNFKYKCVLIVDRSICSFSLPPYYFWTSIWKDSSIHTTTVFDCCPISYSSKKKRSHCYCCDCEQGTKSLVLIDG